jgi:hypothetical protein
MSGQSAHLSIKEAKAMQERIQHSGSQAKTGSKGGSMEHMRKQPHQGKC